MKRFPPGFLFNLLLSLFGIFLSACATRDHVAEEYVGILKKNEFKQSNRTVVFFLIDGLSLQVLRPEMAKLRGLNQYFGDIHTARTVFPSLTFPAISSLLTQSTVDKNG